ncbi:FecCD family ABC transporter permease [Flavihumibacter sp. UBA7668]|uniref:FecCD family ABC transporter permease n=1 Tax=Flavihumibacter sp. UBA7668 TaxID=1946542 RepID=UPI0025B98A83|nr:iron ABC transporter permease [Flavihumibacter sp. UBA7668]
MLSNKKRRLVEIGLLVGLLISVLFSAGIGAVSIQSEEMFSAIQKFIQNKQNLNLNERIFMEIRLPRALLCVLVGASLATGGSLMQALFRNPIVEPGLIGTSSGAAAGAALYFVMGAQLPVLFSTYTLPLASCLGAMLATALVFFLSSAGESKSSSTTALLLTGIAVNAICLSAVGFLSYMARDPQARSITFWSMGTLSGASWKAVGITGLSTIIGIGYAFRLAHPLNTLMLGEQEAMLLGIRIQRLRLTILIIQVILVAVATSFVGVISFVGLIVPHLLRMLHGSDNRLLIRNAALLGAIFLSVADMAARLWLKPAELPIGILTSIVGAPVFLLLLPKTNYF